MSSVHLNGSSASFLRGVEAPAGGPPKSSLNAETERSSGAIAAYMHQNGIDSVDPNQLFAMANNTNGQVPPDVQKAASFMLSHPKIYQKIETHDALGTDGLSSVRNFDQAAQGNIPIDAKPQPAIGAHAAHPAQSLDERAQTAAGALGAYMHANDMGSVDPNQLYSLANNKDGNVPEDVQKAAKFMLKHPGVFQKIDTSDVAGADGISGVGNFDKAAQGLMSFQPPAAAAAAPQPAAAAAPQAAMGTPAAASPDIAQQAQTAAGALGAYMHANDMGSVDPNQLYSLANNKDGNVPEDVQKAAKFMLKHPGVFQKIETSDVAGADGISGVGNFDKAAQGLMSFQPPAAAAAAPQPAAAAAPQAAMGTPAAASPDIAQQAQTAAGALGAYMHANNMGSVDPNQLYSLANNKDGNVPEDVQKAAKFMLKHPGVFQKIETSDVAGADGISGVGNFDKAAQGLTSFQPPAAAAAAPQPTAAAAPQAAMGTPTAASPDIAQQAQTAAGALGAYMHANNMGSVDPNQLYSLANNKDGNVPEDVQKAAKFMLKHPAAYQKIETSDVAGADGISGVGNFDKAAQGLMQFG